MHDPALHLFIDDHHVRATFGMKRVFGTLEKHPEPLLSPWQDRNVCWASILREPDGTFRCWYQSLYRHCVHDMATAGAFGRGTEFGYFPDRFEGAIPATSLSMLAYAESSDGIHWERPALGRCEWRGSKENHLCFDATEACEQFKHTLTNLDTPSVLRDDAEPDPEKRYKFFAHWETFHIYDNQVSKLERDEAYIKQCRASRGRYMTTSPDGIRWDAPLQWVKGSAGGGDYSGITRDERNDCYWYNDRAPAGAGGQWSRTAGLCQSKSLTSWPESVEMVYQLGAYEDWGKRYEHHGMTPFNYGDQDLCSLELSIGGFPIAGILGSHRDGTDWSLPNGHTHFLPLGAQGEMDDAMLAITRNAPIRVGDKLYFYYNGRRHVQDKDTWMGMMQEGFLCLATLRLDGFAGMTVDAPALRRHNRTAFLQTQPLCVQEKELQINLEGHHGSARVALLDGENTQEIPGYGFDDCLPLAEDGVRIPVRWREKADITALQGQKVIVAIQLTAGTIYAVRL